MLKENFSLTMMALLAATALGGCEQSIGNKPLGKNTIILTPLRDRVPLAPDRREIIDIVATLGSTTGSPVGGLRVDSAPESACTVRMTQESLNTDDQGKASFEVRAGTKAETCRIKFSAEQADPVFVEIEVNGKFGGNIVVRSGYIGQVKIARLEVRLHDGRATCDPRWAQLQDLPRGLPAAIQTLTTPKTSQNARFNALTGGAKYIATVVAKNANNRPVAFGCGGPSTVVAAGDTPISVSLDDLTPSVQGKYRFGQEIEFTKFMDPTQTSTRVLKTVASILRNPAEGLLVGIATDRGDHDGLCAYAESITGQKPDAKEISTFCKLAIPLVAAGLQAGVGALGGDSAKRIYDGIKNVAEMVSRPKLGGYLEINTYNSTTKEWTGEYRFDSFVFKWDQAGAKDCIGDKSKNPCCAHKIFKGPDIGLPKILIAQVKGTLDRDTTSGSRSAQYKLSMAEQAIGIAAGAVLQALIENALLPAVLPDNFPGREDKKITFAEFVSGLLRKTSICNDTCQNMINTALDPLITRAANAWTFNGNEQTNIKQKMDGATLVDEDDDLQLDSIQGTLVMTAMWMGTRTPQASEVSFTARYVGDPCEGDTGADQAKYCNLPSAPTNDPYAANVQLVCRFAQDPIDSCFTANFCGAPEGTRKAGESCSINDECYSGTCMTRPTGTFTGSSAQDNKCYKACEAEVDCGGEGHCVLDGYTYVNPNDFSAIATVTGTCVP